MVRTAWLAGFIALLLVCGCGSSSKGTSNGSSSLVAYNSTPQVLQPGSTATLGASATVLVPAGTTVNAPNGNTTIISGSGTLTNVAVGTFVSVPQSATGTANNAVTTVQTTMLASATSTALAGSPATSSVMTDGAGSLAALSLAEGTYLKLDAAGNVIFSDGGRLRKMTQGGVVSTYWNSGLLPGISGVAIDTNEDILSIGSGLSTSSGSSQWYAFAQELTASSVVNIITPSFDASLGVSVGQGGADVDPNGNLYFADRINHRIMKITPGGAVTVFAGTGVAGFANGSAGSATFNSPNDVAFDANGNLFVADMGNSAIRKITPDGTVSTYASGLFQGVAYVAVGIFGDVYAAAPVNYIYRVSAVDGSMVYAPTTLGVLSGLAVDSNGNIYTKHINTMVEIVRITIQ